MPFKSQAQAKFMASKHPEIFARWMKEFHQKIHKLPKRATKAKR
jgi:hypothetical protein